ncbi:MAG: asparagine synthase (glutamine-hydrolyzing) [Magnetospirillum sp. WYHS-4]
MADTGTSWIDAMCGLVGVFAANDASGDAFRGIVAAMLEAIAHRGPNGSGMASGPGFCLGHRRLSIIDLSDGGAQPMATADGRHLIVFNGFISNYLDLRAELAGRGHSFRGTSDTEVLLEMLAADGAAAFPRLNGMFAFLWVDRASGEWWAVRDQLGVKPLYLAPVGDILLAGSEIKALLAHPALEARLDPMALGEYLTFQYCLEDRTLFGGVRKVEPGTAVRGRGGEILETRRYWAPDFSGGEAMAEDEALEALTNALERSIRRNLRSDVRLGTHLSGGLDTSVVATLAAQASERPIEVFCGRFAEGPAYDESRYARRVAESLGAVYHDVVPTAAEFVALMPTLVRLLDEPVAGPGVFPQYMVNKAAAESVTVLLGGQGGDELFGGYARYLIAYLEQALKGAIYGTQESGHYLVTLENVIASLPMIKDYVPLLRQFWQDGLFDAMGARYFRLINRFAQAEAVLDPDVVSAADREAVFSRFAAIFDGQPLGSYINHMVRFDLANSLPALLQVEDRVSMAHGLEVRVPLIDIEVVDIATRLPPRFKFGGGDSKRLLRRAFRGRVVPEVLDRRDKMGFPVPLGPWMAAGPVREFVCDLLNSRSCRERGLWKREGLDAAIATDSGGFRQTWGILCLELWFREFLDCR